ncbi:hypothetical protein AYO49_00810 [Verrucomicrobiaceae bacterium SCGC AG-212-N21]|nr:hypothetical protein AYO49_00810 [Verrucomicrobiaceae bacterium SCGC AG-212-N21]
MLKIKSIEETSSPEDGLRILATRYRGRGLPKSKYDVWMANLGPSEALLGKHETMTWRDWSRCYRDEMLGEAGNEKQNPLIRNAGQKFTLRLIKHLAQQQNVTLLCHCAADAKHCHRFLLRDLIKSSRV